MKTKFNGILTLLLVFTVHFAFAQKTVSGTVSDETGPLPGVSVIIKGTTTGTETDFDGNYSLSANTGAVLQYSYVGMETAFKTVGSNSLINVTMSSSNILDEVVVVAYGVQKKAAITGSITKIDDKKIKTIQTANVVKGLTGKVAGVQIVSESGQPGSSPTVRFRGIGSINAGTSPLYVVDGIPFAGQINSINPQDIASMTFLKDAEAGALYGSRGANGVVIITTKKGKNKDIRINLDFKTNISTRAVPEYKIIKDPGQYYEAFYQASKNNLMFNHAYSAEDAANLASQNLVDDTAGLGYSLNYNIFDLPNNGLINTATGKMNAGNTLYQENWADYLFNDSVSTQSFVSVTGGSDKADYYFSLGYDDTAGYTVNSGFKRITSKLNTTQRITDNLKLIGTLSYANSLQDYVDGDGSSSYSNLFSWTRAVAPIYPVFGYNNDGSPVLDSNGNQVYDFGDTANGTPNVRPYGSIQNPYATALNDIKQRENDNINGKVSLQYNFFEDFKFTYNYSATARMFNGTSFDTAIGGDAGGVNGRGVTSTSKRIAQTHQQLLNWNKSFGDHNLSLLAGHESYDMDYEYFDASKTNFILPSSNILDFGGLYQYMNNFERNYNIEGYLSRATYNYDNKYYLSGSYRRDASSIFHPDDRWGNFWGVGAAWRIGKENFLSDVDWLNEFKLKASIGSQGNDVIYYPGSSTRNYYAYRTQYSVGSNAGELTISPYYLVADPHALTWETTTNSNYGFEASFFNNNFNINAEYFKRDISDMLFDFPAEIYSLGSFTRNIGDMENKGFEITLDANLIKNDNFRWSVDFNTTHYKNKVTKLHDRFTEDGIDDGLYQLNEGYSRYDYYMREFAGVNSDTGAAQWWQYTDAATGEDLTEPVKTEVYTNADEVYIGKTAIPDFYGGFGTSMEYKGFDLGLDFAYQKGGYAFDGTYWGLFNASGDKGRNMHQDVFNAWTPENTTSNIPRIDTESTRQFSTSDMFLIDSSYLSLQNVSLGYNFHNDMINKIGFSSLRVYVLANNVKLWSQRQGFDPRLSLTGRTSNEYSLTRTYSLGFNLAF